MLQKIASVASELRGKKIAISLSPGWFFFYDKAPADAYAANFSRLHAGSLVFSSDLNWDLKRAAAKRMLEYPDTVADDPILRFGLQSLAGNSLPDRLLYWGLLPLGHLQNALLRLQDHWATLKLIGSRTRIERSTQRERRRIDWNALRSEAEAIAAKQAGDNPFGFNNQAWHQQEPRWSNRKFTDDGFTAGMDRSREWVDLELLLRGLEQLGARPLVLSMPISGLFLDHLGTSAASRQKFYSRLQSIAQMHHIEVNTFADHDADKYFISDPGDHLGPKGWVYYVQAIDTFYHQGKQ
jgi:D-alanine transfer protein